MEKLRELIEAALIGKIVGAMLDEGYRVEISDQDGGGFYIYGWADNAQPEGVGAARHWVSLTIGNDPVDLIRDYSVNFKPVMQPIEAWLEQIAG